MPNASLKFTAHIHAPPEKVFAYINDLTRHGEWSANALCVNAVTPGPVKIGSEYRSSAQVRGVNFAAELRVTGVQPPVRFAFSGRDSTGQFEHQFNLKPERDGTHLERKINFTLTFRQWLMFLMLLYPVRLPAGKKALRQLNEQLAK